MDLQVYLAAMTAFRQQGRCLHLMADALALIVLGTLAGCTDYDQITDFGISEFSYLRGKQGLVLTNGVPSARILTQLMGMLRGDKLELSLHRVLQALLEPVGQRNTPLPHPQAVRPRRRRAEQLIVSAWSAGNTLCLGQVLIGEKNTATIALPVLLSLLDCRRTIVRLETTTCSKATIKQVLAGDGDYLVGVTATSKLLYRQIANFWTNQPPAESVTLVRCALGRTEQHRFAVADAPPALVAAARWPAFRRLILLETTTHHGEEETTTQRYYLSSRNGFSAQQAADLISQNWPQANQLHWGLDITIDEADVCARFQQSEANLRIVQRFCAQLPSGTHRAIPPPRAERPMTPLLPQPVLLVA